MSHISRFSIPTITNEPNLHYEPGSPEQQAVLRELEAFRKAGPLEVPCFVDGQSVKTGKTVEQVNPSNFSEVVANVHQADAALTKHAINSALEAKKSWEKMTWEDRACVFLKAADLLSTKYRAKICAATMIGQGKNYWQAEIDAAAELIDFLRFGVKYVEDIYSIQPPANAKGVWNRTEYRPLDGFVLAITPFNFTAIAGNLFAVPAILGNVVLWKPSPMAVLSAQVILDVFHEAGMPKGVVQFLPGPPEPICETAFSHPDFAGLHFTGSTTVFKGLWKQIVNNIDNLKSYPRIVGETGGKNFHLVHPSANVDEVVAQSIRAAFEFQGQKCSALSRLYVPESMWPTLKSKLSQAIKSIKQGAPEENENFMGPVISKMSFDKITSFVKKAVDEGAEIVAGGKSDMSKGFFIEPTVLCTKDPKSVTMTTELFGPVITTYVYPDAEFQKMPALIEETTQYALTGAVFARDREVLSWATEALRGAAGNFYVNDKCTGAVVGQQPFGGAKASGTDDKAGSAQVFYRFLNSRSIKENFIAPSSFLYPSNITKQ